MPIHDELVADLLSAYVNGGTVAATHFADLTREEAALVQLGFTKAVSTTVRAAKIGVSLGGTAVVAAIPDNLILAAGDTLVVPQRGFVGLEVEVAVRISQDISSGSEVDVSKCIDEVLLTIELIGPRLDDPTQAGEWGAFADLMITGGLIVGSRLNEDAVAPDGQRAVVSVNGSSSEWAAKHPFGNALVPLQAFANVSAPGLDILPAGSVVTTGSLGPLIPVPAAGEIVVTLGSSQRLLLNVTSAKAVT